MSIEKNIEKLSKKYIDMETQIAKDIESYDKEFQKLKNPILKQEFILNNILPLKIKGSILMEKLNTFMSLELGNLKNIREILNYDKKLKDRWTLMILQGNAIND